MSSSGTVQANIEMDKDPCQPIELAAKIDRATEQ